MFITYINKNGQVILNINIQLDIIHNQNLEEQFAFNDDLKIDKFNTEYNNRIARK